MSASRLLGAAIPVVVFLLALAVVWRNHSEEAGPRPQASDAASAPAPSTSSSKAEAVAPPSATSLAQAPSAPTPSSKPAERPVAVASPVSIVPLPPAPTATAVPQPVTPPTSDDRAHRELEAILARADAAASKRLYRKAAEEARLLLGRASDPALRAQFEPRASDLIDLAKLFSEVVAALPTLKDRSWRVGKDLVGTLGASTEASLEVKVGGAFTSVAWSEVPSERIVDLVRRAGNPDPYALSIFCFDNALDVEASQTLAALLKRTPSAEARAFGLVARARKVALPADGFVFHKDRWLTRTEDRDATLIERVEALATRIRDGRSDEVMGAARGIETALSDASSSPALADRGHALLVEALLARRTSLLDRLRKNPAMLSLERMKALKRELNAARAEALKTIFDLKVYPDEDHGRVGQPAVDAKVKVVRELWERPADAAAGSDAVARETIAGVREIDGMLEKLDAARPADEGLDVALAGLSQRMTLRTVALDKKERDLVEYNDKAWAYNAKVESSMTEDERRVVTLVNQYREMMGLRCLEYDDCLAKGARGHSEDMAKRGFFAHENPEGKGPSDRCFAAGYPHAGVGENIAMGMCRAEEAHEGWYNSSGHHRNMLFADYTQMGCGRNGKAGVHWTEDFGTAAGKSQR